MTRYSRHLCIFSMPVLCLLLFTVCFFISPIKTLAQTRSTSLSTLLSKRISRIQASFTYSPTYPAAGQIVQFASSSNESRASLSWDFGDGTTSTAQNPSHSFSMVGFYRVTMTIVTASGSKSVMRTVSVASSSTVKSLSSLVASFNYSPTSPVAGQAIKFTDTSMGSPTSWQWNFGDGSTSTVQNPSHTFTTAASYTVSLTASNSSGSKNISQTITVSAALTASFIFSPTTPIVGQSVHFTDTSTGSPTSWQWDFGDGATSTAQSPSHTYATVASNNVTLSARNNAGSKSVSRTISILPSSALIASFTYLPTSPVAGQAVQFTDTSTGTPNSWQWDFGDGVFSTAQNPSHSYVTPGPYAMILMIGSGSNSSTTSGTINVAYPSTITAASPSLLDVTAAISSANPGDTVAVPAGQATWDNQLIITKGINLIGAGIDNTVIHSNYSATDPNNQNDTGNYLIYYQPASPSANEPFRISGFSFDLGSKSYGVIVQNPTSSAINKIRLDHNKIEKPIQTQYGVNIYVHGMVWGVADSNELYDGYCRTNGYGALAWDTITFSYGSADNFYFEDNNFYRVGNQMIFYTETGGRYVARYNTIDASASTSGFYPFADAHGNMGSGSSPGTMGVEIYGNTLNMGSKPCCFFDQRGGMALCYNNTINSDGSVTIKVREEYADRLDSPSASSLNGEPNYVSQSYYWGNRKNGVSQIDEYYIQDTIDYAGEVGILPRFNVNVWYENPLFDGSQGVGVGALANRPSVCVKGVAYWATDTKVLYRCESSDTWGEYYRPYTYPHPLRTQ